ncbi:hypothetical protein Tco_0105565 [Tanacetum coccineum]
MDLNALIIMNFHVSKAILKDDRDEISNLVRSTYGFAWWWIDNISQSCRFSLDLHMGMLGGGWKWQDLQSLLWRAGIIPSEVKMFFSNALISEHHLGIRLWLSGYGGGWIHDDSSYRRDSVNGGARHGNFVRVAKDGDDNASN